MAYSIGLIFGMLLSNAVTCGVWALILRWVNFKLRIWMAPLFGYVTSALLSALGHADGGAIDWSYGFSERVLPGVAVGIFYAAMVWGQNQKPAKRLPEQ